jgi:iron complex transport system substrate-binding protein
MPVQEIKTAAAISISDNESSSAKRVIALANGAAEIIVAMGLKPILIGRDIASTEEILLDIPIVTNGHQVVAENILKLNPDLVLIDDATGPKSTIDSLRQSGIDVVQVRQAWTFSDIDLKIADIAGAISAIPSGVALSREIGQSLTAVKAADRKARILFLYLRGGNSIYLLGGKGSGADSLITAINCIDVGAEFSADPFTPVSAEILAGLNPDVILVMSKGLASVGGVTGLRELPGVAQTEAGKKGRILAVDDSLLLSFGPRTPDLIIQMAAAVDELMK